MWTESCMNNLLKTNSPPHRECWRLHRCFVSKDKMAKITVIGTTPKTTLANRTWIYLSLTRRTISEYSYMEFGKTDEEHRNMMPNFYTTRGDLWSAPAMKQLINSWKIKWLFVPNFISFLFFHPTKGWLDIPSPFLIYPNEFFYYKISFADNQNMENPITYGILHHIQWIWKHIHIR